LALTAVLLLSGCLQSEKTVTVRPDGSGTVEERFLMRTEFVQMIAGMAESASGESFSLLDREKLREEASDMGNGVSFESAEEVQTDWGQGYVVRYSFDDISTLRLNQNPGDNVPTQGSGGPDTETTEYVEFSFTEGSPAELEISLPRPTEGSDGSDSSDGGMGSEGGMGGEDIGDSQLQQVMQFYRDMKIVLQMEFEDRIVNTNASFREGNTITLMNLDFNAILEDQERAKGLLSQEADSLAELQNALGDVSGVQAESEPTVRVLFR
jgi:hypothetical protein